MKYIIFQLDATNKTVTDNRLLFEGWFRASKTIQEHSLSLYKQVYEGEKPDGEVFGRLVSSILEQLFIDFNSGTRPDFHGHSLSVSDIICLQDGPNKDYYFCDSYGWMKILNINEPGKVTAIKLK